MKAFFSLAKKYWKLFLFVFLAIAGVIGKLLLDKNSDDSKALDSEIKKKRDDLLKNDEKQKTITIQIKEEEKKLTTSIKADSVLAEQEKTLVENLEPSNIDESALLEKANKRVKKG